MGSEWVEAPKHRKRRSPMDTGGRPAALLAVIRWWESIVKPPKSTGRHEK